MFAWLRATEAHPLIASSIFHDEFEFIHPFADENGRRHGTTVAEPDPDPLEPAVRGHSGEKSNFRAPGRVLPGDRRKHPSERHRPLRQLCG
ncbi:Fic family protein [Thiorhodovibrio winogradskyi]|uniref:Fic family protein n=1 Tax=Thiorhodovibrio winogradskyi TaxID=77007 RepID=UPI002E2E3195|nr:Fic family protein [Thiorhodovibrio winogradskyi]